MPTDREPFLSAGEIAAFLGVTPETAREWARTGVIPGHQPGGRVWLFKASEVDAAVKASRARAEKPANPMPIRNRRQPVHTAGVLGPIRMEQLR